MKIFALTSPSDNQALLEKGFKEAGVYTKDPVDADVYFCGGLGRVELFIEMMRDLGPKPVVNWILDIPEWRLTHPEYRKRYQLWHDFLKDSALNISISYFTQKELKRLWGFDSHVIRPPINQMAMKAVPEQVKENQVISISRFAPHKRFELGIQMVGQCDSRPKYIIMGGGDLRYKPLYYRTSLQHKANIKMLFEATNEEKFTHLKKSKVLIAPSEYEGLGLTPVEAYYCNVPFLATDLEVTREVLGKSYPFLFNSLDDGVDKLEYLLSLDVTQYESRVFEKTELMRNIMDYLHPTPSMKIIDLIEKELGIPYLEPDPEYL